MLSAVARKSLTDLTRRKGRSTFAILTLAIAVASIGIFAIPALADQMMQKEIRAAALADLVVDTKPLALTPSQLAALGRLPNVVAVDGRAFYSTRAYVGARRINAYVIGVPDFAHQQVDIVHVASGTPPDDGGALTEGQNARQGRYDGRAGDTIRVIAADSTTRTLRITGVGRNMSQALAVNDDMVAVLYTTPATAAELSGATGFNSFSFRLRDARTPAADATAAAVARYLRANTSFTGFTNLPAVRTPGDWPGKDMFERFSGLLYVLTVLALLSALVLIVNTMTTLVGEQTGEIGQMKAIGATNRQITAVYLRTALLLGAISCGIGAALGVGLANLVTNYFGSSMYGTPARLGVDPTVLTVSVAIGLVGPMLASLPAIRRGVRMPAAEALAATGAETGGSSRLDVALRRIAFLPRTAQIGVRGVGRRKRRSLTTTLQIAFAVATLLAVLGLGASIGNLTRSSWNDHQWQIAVGSGLQLDQLAEAVIRATPGVAAAEPVIASDAKVDDHVGSVWGVSARTLFRYRLAAGRWYTPAEERAKARVVVLENAIARAAGAHVGDRITLATSAGPASFRVIGLLHNVQENGNVAFVPLETIRTVLRSPGAVNGYWITTTSPSHDAIDATTTAVEDALTGSGYQVGTEITYVAEADEVAANRQLGTTITVLGFLVVAISMVGLVSAMTMNVLERTREVGILRCLGARGKDIRRIFATEGLVLALMGWLVGIPLGYLLDRLFGWLIGQIFGFDLAVAFPPVNVLIALAGTVVLALLIMRLPLRRAVRFRPGDALRYA